jgi:hypothetical protein
MSLKKNLRMTCVKGQIIVEYIVIFTVLVLGIIAVFGGFNLGDSQGTGSNLNIKAVFDQAVDGAINQISR